MPFIFKKISNSAETNYGPLSDIKNSRSPYTAKSFLSSSIVLCDDDIRITSTQFE